MTFLLKKKKKIVITMSNTFYESNEDFVNRVNNYHKEVLDTEKEELPGGKLLKDKFSWDIVKKSATVAINDVFSHFNEALKNLDLSYTAPEGTSFRIVPPQRSFAYRSGVRKIIVSMDLRKNNNILSRSSIKNYVIEVSIHDDRENYLHNHHLNYTKECYIREFSDPNFEDNIKNVMTEVYRIMTFSQIFNINNYYN